MPLYTYECEECKKQLEVLRTIANSSVLPQPDEMEETECKHVWRRIILSPPSVAYGSGWSPYGGRGKGNW